MSNSPNKGYTLQATGANVGTWGSELNTNALTIIDNNLGGVVTKTLTNANVTLSATEAQNLTVVLNGTLSGNVQITNPCVGQFYVDNQCVMGSYTLTVTNGVGSAVSISSAAKIAVIADGTNGCRQVGAGVTQVATGFGLTGGPISSTGTASISTSAPPFGFNAPINASISCAVAANAITVALKDQSGADASSTSPVLVPFRSATASTGTPSWLSITSSLSLTVSSGSTLGASNSTAFRIWVVLFNNGGTPALGVINCLTSSGVVPLYEAALSSTTAEGGAGGADSAGVFYTSSALTTKAFRILGYFEYTSGLTTAGTWNAAPDILQLFGPGVKKPGDTIQKSYTTATAVSSITTIIPSDDTVPQNTEGAQVLSLTVTPLSKSNFLVIESNAIASYSAAVCAIALFQDSTVSALSANGLLFPGGTGQISVKHQMQSNASSSTTFKIRLGPGTFGGTLTFNGGNNGATRGYGGVAYSRLTVEEIMA